MAKNLDVTLDSSFWLKSHGSTLKLSVIWPLPIIFTATTLVSTTITSFLNYCNTFLTALAVPTLPLSPHSFLNMANRGSHWNIKPNHACSSTTLPMAPSFFIGFQGPAHASKSPTPPPLISSPHLVLPTLASWQSLKYILHASTSGLWQWLLPLPGTFFYVDLYALLLYLLKHFAQIPLSQ